MKVRESQGGKSNNILVCFNFIFISYSVRPSEPVFGTNWHLFGMENVVKLIIGLWLLHISS